MDEQAVTTEHITLTEAAKIAPGRPSTNCMWRWCRRGVLARTGQRVRLQHIRVGGKIFTTPAWLEEFGRRLADTDAAYFDGKAEAARRLPPRDPRFGPPKRRARPRPAARLRPAEDLNEIERELQESGL